MKIKIIYPDEGHKIIDSREPRGYFLFKEKNWIALDNSTGEAWTEGFKWIEEARKYLIKGGGEI